MADPRFPIPPLPTDEQPPSSRQKPRSGEVGRSRFEPPLTARQHLQYFVVLLLLGALGLGLYGYRTWQKIRAAGGHSYPLPDYTYLHGHCFPRHRAGVVGDAACEQVLYLTDPAGQRRPRFHFDTTQQTCYDTILDTHHAVPTEFCNRKAEAP
jgi:hypothetical protein